MGVSATLALQEDACVVLVTDSLMTFAGGESAGCHCSRLVLLPKGEGALAHLLCRQQFVHDHDLKPRKAPIILHVSHLMALSKSLSQSSVLSPPATAELVRRRLAPCMTCMGMLLSCLRVSKQGLLPACQFGL